MKKIIAFYSIMLLITTLNAQSPEEIDQFNIDISDSLNTENTIADTISSIAENIDIYNEMNQFLNVKRENENELVLSHLVYNENFHLSSPYNFDVYLKENRFSKIQFATSALQSIQNNRKIYEAKHIGENLTYNNYEYSLPVAITESYMGLGDNNMNNIYFSFLKGNILGVQNLNFQLDFLGEKGTWLGYEDESTQNMDIYLSYKLGSSIFHFNNSSVDQELPGEKSLYSHQFAFDTTKNEETEYSFLLENKIVDLGIKYEKIDFKIEDKFFQERDLTQFLISKEIDLGNHSFILSDEFMVSDIKISDETVQDTITLIDREENYNLVSYNHNSRIKGLSICNTGFFRNSNYYSHYSELQQELLFGSSLVGEYFTRAKEYYPSINSISSQNYEYSKIGVGIGIKASFMNSKIVLGKQSTANAEENYLDFHNRFTLSITQKFSLNLKQWIGYEILDMSPENSAHIIDIPEWQAANYLQFVYDMDHNNAIKLGLNYHYHSDYSYLLDDLEYNNRYNNSSQNLDIKLSLQITDRFEISADAINITDQKVMFTNQSHPGTHFNFNVHWIFIN